MKENLDKFFSVVGPARYQYRLKCRLEAGARLKKLAILNDLQMAPLTLPEMVVGRNVFTYRDETPGPRRVEDHAPLGGAVHFQPPPAPAGAVARRTAAGATARTSFSQWLPAEGRIGDLPVRALAAGGREAAAVDGLLQAHLPHGRRQRDREAPTAISPAPRSRAATRWPCRAC